MLILNSLTGQYPWPKSIIESLRRELALVSPATRPELFVEHLDVPRLGPGATSDALEFWDDLDIAELYARAGQLPRDAATWSAV